MDFKLYKMDTKSTMSEPDFSSWSIDELFYHLIDLYLIPYEEEINDWIHYKEYMIHLCKESYERQKL